MSKYLVSTDGLTNEIREIPTNNGDSMAVRLVEGAAFAQVGDMQNNDPISAGSTTTWNSDPITLIASGRLMIWANVIYQVSDDVVEISTIVDDAEAWYDSITNAATVNRQMSHTQFAIVNAAPGEHTLGMTIASDGSIAISTGGIHIMWAELAGEYIPPPP